MMQTGELRPSHSLSTAKHSTLTIATLFRNWLKV